MAWLQTLAGWFDNTLDPNVQDEDADVSLQRLASNMYEREQTYLGDGSKTRDAEELAKLRGMWDDTKWMAAHTTASTSRLTLPSGAVRPQPPQGVDAKASYSLAAAAPAEVIQPPQPEECSQVRSQGADGVEELRAHMQRLQSSNHPAEAVAMKHQAAEAALALEANQLARHMNAPRIAAVQAMGEVRAEDYVNRPLREPRPATPSMAAPPQGDAPSEPSQAASVCWTKDTLVELARQYSIRYQDEVWGAVRSHVLLESGQDAFTILEQHDAHVAAQKRIYEPEPTAEGPIGPKPHLSGFQAPELWHGNQKEKAQGWDVAPEPKLEVSTGISSLAEILHTVEGDQRMGSALSVRVLACKGREMQDELVSKGVLGPLVDMLTKCSPPGQAAAAGAIQKIVSHHKENQMEAVRMRAVPPLVKMVWGDNATTEGRKHATCALRNIANAPSNIEHLMNGGVAAPLVRLLELAVAKMALPQRTAQSQEELNLEELATCHAAAETVRNLAGNEATVPAGRMTDTAMNSIFGAAKRPSKAFVDAGVVPALVCMLRNGRTEHAWEVSAGAICNICHSNPHARSQVLSSYVVPYLVEVYMCAGPRAKAAAAAALWAVYSISSPNELNTIVVAAHQEQTDASPLCWSDGVRAWHCGVWLHGEGAWWEPPVPLVRMLQDSLEHGAGDHPLAPPYRMPLRDPP
ncbi:hypothetical protein CYMTET_35064 [Cymbomonas tetramitiformis]|uniref:Uncharacterized protein n=1 Tax=Cymbomonas tetramitiformis TaxID=36881 RepID=A0AAE0FA16_9CHLO|nr:hypothetical protein CYMTET_35064 [Cymbomonas tetramitiformis]